METNLICVAAITRKIALMEGNAAGLDNQDDQMIHQLENTELFKELTDHTLAQITSDLQAYLGVLREVREEMKANDGQLPNTESAKKDGTK
jgi:hypothetical protein